MMCTVIVSQILIADVRQVIYKKDWTKLGPKSNLVVLPHWLTSLRSSVHQLWCIVSVCPSSPYPVECRVVEFVDLEFVQKYFMGDKIKCGRFVHSHCHCNFLFVTHYEYSVTDLWEGIRCTVLFPVWVDINIPKKLWSNCLCIILSVIFARGRNLKKKKNPYLKWINMSFKQFCKF